MNNLDTLMEEYLLTLEHDVEDRHYDDEWTSEREDAHAELERFMDWVHHEKKARIIYRLRPEALPNVGVANLPVKKRAWMVVYPDESISNLFNYETEAKKWASYSPEKCKVVQVTWEV